MIKLSKGNLGYYDNYQPNQKEIQELCGAKKLILQQKLIKPGSNKVAMMKINQKNSSLERNYFVHLDYIKKIKFQF